MSSLHESDSRHESELVIRKRNCGITTNTDELYCADSIGLQIFHHNWRLSLGRSPPIFALQDVLIVVRNFSITYFCFQKNGFYLDTSWSLTNNRTYRYNIKNTHILGFIFWSLHYQGSWIVCGTSGLSCWVINFKSLLAQWSRVEESHPLI